MIVPFPVTIPEAEQNKTLAAQIITCELPGVFNWIPAGLQRLLSQNGFTDCEVARQQIDEYRRQSDSVRLFLEEYGYVATPSAW